MGDVDDGGPAIPIVGRLSDIQSSGITKRDLFAAAALMGTLAGGYLQTIAELGINVEQVKASVIDSSYEWADLMLERRKK